MAMPLKKNVTRELGEYFRGRPLVARMAREGMYIKRKGERWTSAYLVPWDAVYSVGAKIKAKALKAEQAARRKARPEVRSLL